MGQIEELTKRFNDRDQHYIDVSNSIFESLPHMFDAMKIYLSGVTEYQLNVGVIYWKEIDLIDGIIMLQGFIEYDNGASIRHNDTEVVITSDNAEEYYRPIRVGIPLNVAVEYPTQEIVKYFDGIGNSSSDDLVSTTFDLDGLTASQIEAIKNQTFDGDVIH